MKRRVGIVGIAAFCLLAPGTVAAQSLDEPGGYLEEARRIAQQLLPIDSLTVDDGFLTALDVAEFRRLPLVKEEAARAVGFRAEHVRLTHHQQLQSLDGLTLIDIRVSYIEDDQIPEAYIEARLTGDRAHAAPMVDAPSVMVKADGGDDSEFRSVFAARGHLLISVVGTYGDGATIDYPELENVTQRLANRQLAQEGSGEWELIDASLEKLVAEVRPDYSEPTSELLSASFGTVLIAFLLIKGFTAVTDPVSRRRLAVRFRLARQPVLPSRPDVVDVSPLSTRRRWASRMLSARRWTFGALLVVGVPAVVIALPLWMTGQATTAQFLRFGTITAVGVGGWFGVGRLVRWWADKQTPELARLDATPKGYGTLGRRTSIAFLIVLGTTITMLSLGIAAVAASSIARGAAAIEEISLDPRAEALRKFTAGIPFGLSLIAAAAAPARWLRSRRNQALSLAADDDPRSTILFLRSFGDDQLRVNRELRQQIPLVERLRFSLRITYEDMVVRRLWLNGAVVAVGEPGTRPPALGATRAFFGTEWTSAVRGAIEGSQLVAVSLGTTKGIRWELRQLQEMNALGRSIFIVPPTPDASTRLAILGDALDIQNPPDPQSIPLVVSVDPETRLATYYCDRFRSEAGYGAALDHAVFEQLRWAPQRPALSAGSQSPPLGPSPPPPPAEEPLRPPPSEHSHGTAAHETATPSDQSQAVPVHGTLQRERRRWPRPRFSWLGVIAIFLATPFIDQAFDIIGSYPSITEIHYQTPTPLYSASREDEAPTALWGADFLIFGSRFTREGIRPVAVDYDPTADRLAILDRERSLLVLDGSTGRTTAALNNTLGARDLEWVSGSVVTLQPAAQSLLIWQPGAAVRTVELGFYPITIEETDGNILVGSATGGLRSITLDGQTIHNIPTQHPVRHVIPLEDRFVLDELITGSPR